MARNSVGVKFLLVLYDLDDEGVLWPSGTMEFSTLQAARSYGNKVISEKGATHYVVTDGKSQRPRAFHGFKTSGQAERYGLTRNPAPGRKSAGEQKMTFEKLHEPFKAWLSQVASEHGKPVEQVFAWWREYTQHCRNYDQSPVQSEFLDWYRDRLSASGSKNPAPGRKSACGSAGGRENPHEFEIGDIVRYEGKEYEVGYVKRGLSDIVGVREDGIPIYQRAPATRLRLQDVVTHSGTLQVFPSDVVLVKPVEGVRLNPSDSGIKFVYGILGEGDKKWSEVQSVLFDRASYTVAQAKKWLQSHGFKYGAVDKGGAKAEYLRFRQQDPGRYRAMRTGEAGAKNPDYTRFSPEEGGGRLLQYVVTDGNKVVFQSNDRLEAYLKYERLLLGGQDAVLWGKRKSASYLKTALYKKLSLEEKGNPEMDGGNPILGMGALPPHVLIQHPNGVWSFVGRVDARLSYQRKDGSEASEEELRKAAQFGPGLMGLKTRVWATQAEAEQAAAELGIKVGQVSPYRRSNPEWPRVLEFVDTARDGAQAREMLDGLKLQDGFVGGRILEPSPATPTWRVQAFFQDVPEMSEEDARFVGLHKAVLPPGVERRMERNPDGIHEFYYTDESGHRIGEQTTDLESGFRLGVSLAKTYSMPVRIWIGSAQAESGWKQWGQVTPETTEEAVKRAVMLFTLHGRELNPESSVGSHWLKPGEDAGYWTADSRRNFQRHWRERFLVDLVKPSGRRVFTRILPRAHVEGRKLALNAGLQEYFIQDQWNGSLVNYNLDGVSTGREALAEDAPSGRMLYLPEHEIRDSVRRSNPESESQSAAALYEQFHGRPSSETLEYHEEIEVPDELAGLGDLTEIKVATMSGLDVTLSFEDDPPKLCSTPDGRQLHILGGDQSIPLDKIKMDSEKWFKDSMVIGVLTQGVYRTRKSFHKFVLTLYEHKMGEVTGVQPMLIYDTLNKTLSVSGGNYRVTAAGVEN